MTRLLQRQIKRTFDKNFDISTLPEDVQKLLKRIDSSYEDFEAEQKILENTLEVNSAELSAKNKLIKEKSLQTSSILEQYKQALDDSLIVSKTDLQGNITYANDNFCKTSGYTREELIGSSHNIIRHPETDEKVFKELWKKLFKKQKWRGTLANLAKDGSSYYVDLNAMPLLDINNNITEFIAISEDITENVQLQKVSLHLHERTKLVMDTQESMIIISDSIHGVVDANQKFYNISGFKNLQDFKKEHECICELFIEKENYLRQSTPEMYWVEPVFNNPHEIHKALLLDAEGNEVIFDVRARKILLDDREYVLTTFSDITDIENMREKAESAEKAKSEFLANMSHEIRTPMNGISGFLQLLEKTELNEQQKKYLSITQSSVKTLLHIINDILDFSKIESGQMESELVEINPFVELEKVFTAFAPNAREKNISLQIDLDSKLHENLYIDELHIRQVMQNLINNAIKFTSEHGTIIASVQVLQDTEDSQKVRFGVRDNGIGIAKENQEKVLQAFSQADNSTTRKFGGTGLGLSISCSLVKLMGAELQLQSALDEGSFFYFDLVVKKAKVTKSLSEHLQNQKICCIDSQTKHAEKIQTILENFNIDCQILSETKITKELCSDKNFQILITTNPQMYMYIPDTMEMLLINEDRSLLSKKKNVLLVNNFDECPSVLYNSLLSKDMIVHESNENSELIVSLKVLIAEDYEINQILLEELLKNYKQITYTFTKNGQEVVDEYRKNPDYDLILMDINMPVLDGIEATKILRKETNIPIVALTANALDGDKERFLSFGMDDYLAKPIEVSELERVLLSYADINNISSGAPDLEEGSFERTTVDSLKEAIKKTQERTKFPDAIIDKLLKTYMKSSDTLMQNLQEGVANKNYDTIMRAAHDLKSSSLTLCFTQIGELAAEVEKYASEKKNFSYEEATAVLQKHFDDLKVNMPLI